MKIAEYIDSVRENVAVARRLGKQIALVPTMGSLHSGHLSMVEELRQDDDQKNIYIVMSIFVNPLQFGAGEDFEKYPRDLTRDIGLAQEAGVDLLFTPSVAEMYPNGRSLTTVEVTEVSEGLCGGSRPGHFRGVATVVAKLFHIVQPDIAIFGQKDYQQLAVIKQMVKDLCWPVVLMMAPTVREADGLAMSSRNAYLSAEERRQAPVLYQALQEGADLIRQGQRSAAQITAAIRQIITENSSAVVEYIEIRRGSDLKVIEEVTEPVVILVAARLGNTRLIDNVLAAREGQ